MLNLQDVERDIDNLNRVQLELERIVAEGGAMDVFLVDENGFLIAEVGSTEIDKVALSALVAASFGANAEIARILGEPDFSRLIHQGTTRHLFIGKAGERHILIVVFGRETNLGLVKLYAERSCEHIGAIMDAESTPPDAPEPDAGGEPSPDSGEDDEGLLTEWLSEDQ